MASGYARIGSYDAFALARYNTDGSLDTGFDTGKTRALWEAALAGPLGGRPVRRPPPGD